MKKQITLCNIICAVYNANFQSCGEIESTQEFEFVGEINGDACEENKRLPLALFNNAENRVVHLWRWIRYDSAA